MIANIDAYNIGMINGFNIYKTNTMAIRESKLKAFGEMWFFVFIVSFKENKKLPRDYIT